MKDYYALGENVWGAEEENKPTRLETIEETLAHYEKLENSADYEVIKKEFRQFLNCLYKYIENWWD